LFTSAVSQELEGFSPTSEPIECTGRVQSSDVVDDGNDNESPIPAVKFEADANEGVAGGEDPNEWDDANFVEATDNGGGDDSDDDDDDDDDDNADSDDGAVKGDDESAVEAPLFPVADDIANGGISRRLRWLTSEDATGRWADDARTRRKRGSDKRLATFPR